MALPFTQGAIKEAAPQEFPFAGQSLTVLPLNSDQESDALAFLAERSLHTVFMAGYIHDNGITGDLNRGAFYGCRNRKGDLEGVALIGHTTLVEARSEAALAAFACFARYSPSAYMILGEQEKVERFWSQFARPGQVPRRACREVLLERRQFAEPNETSPGLRLALPEDIAILLPVYAEMALEESGNNPLDVDPEGFYRRWANRIERGRIWVWIENERLIFNACVMADTPDCIYLEGIYVNSAERGKGVGSRCMSQLSHYLLTPDRSLCVLVSERDPRAQNFFQKAGFEYVSHYDTLFLYRET